jgi:hypothetical protein
MACASDPATRYAKHSLHVSINFYGAILEARDVQLLRVAGVFPVQRRAAVDDAEDVVEFQPSLCHRAMREPDMGLTIEAGRCKNQARGWHSGPTSAGPGPPNCLPHTLKKMKG